MPTEAETQTDYTLSDILHFEDLKATFLHQRDWVQSLVHEAASYKEVRKKIHELFCQEIRIKPRTPRFNIRV